MASALLHTGSRIVMQASCVCVAAVAANAWYSAIQARYFQPPDSPPAFPSLLPLPAMSRLSNSAARKARRHLCHTESRNHTPEVTT
eukprot:6461983-Amphidinium_carterae.1